MSTLHPPHMWICMQTLNATRAMGGSPHGGFGGASTMKTASGWLGFYCGIAATRLANNAG